MKLSTIITALLTSGASQTASMLAGEGYRAELADLVADFLDLLNIPDDLPEVDRIRLDSCDLRLRLLPWSGGYRGIVANGGDYVALIECAPPPRECRACGCTEEKACVTADGPCAWSATDPRLCTACEEAYAEFHAARGDEATHNGAPARCVRAWDLASEDGGGVRVPAIDPLAARRGPASFAQARMETAVGPNTEAGGRVYGVGESVNLCNAADGKPEGWDDVSAAEQLAAAVMAIPTVAGNLRPDDLVERAKAVIGAGAILHVHLQKHPEDAEIFRLAWAALRQALRVSLPEDDVVDTVRQLGDGLEQVRGAIASNGAALAARLRKLEAAVLREVAR